MQINMNDLKAKVASMGLASGNVTPDVNVPVLAIPGSLAPSMIPSVGDGSPTINREESKDVIQKIAEATKKNAPVDLTVREGTIPFSPKQGNSKSTFVVGTGDKFHLDAEGQRLQKLPPAVPVAPPVVKPYAAPKIGA